MKTNENGTKLRDQRFNKFVTLFRFFETHLHVCGCVLASVMCQVKAEAAAKVKWGECERWKGIVIEPDKNGREACGEIGGAHLIYFLKGADL